MLTLLRLCWRVYDFSLYFYPAELRETFGSDMSEVFRLQTVDAWAEGGVALLLRVVLCGIGELFTAALPARAGSPLLIAGTTSLICTSAVFWCLLWALQNPLALKTLGGRLQLVLWGG